MTAGISGAVVGSIVALATSRHAQKRATATEGWQVVTVFLPTAPQELPAPLAALGDTIETRWETAAGDKGVELFARPRDGRTSRADLRSALRQAKQLLEAGEVLQADSPGTTRATVLNLPLRATTRRAGRLGHL